MKTVFLRLAPVACPLALLLLHCAPSTAQQTPANPEKDEIYLLEQSLKSLRVVERVELPQRVYLMKTRMDGKYQHSLSHRKGQIDRPHILLAGTVVRGDRIGGSIDRFYVLTAEGNWRRTLPPEVYKVQNDDESRQEYLVTPGFIGDNDRSRLERIEDQLSSRTRPVEKDQGKLFQAAFDQAKQQPEFVRMDEEWFKKSKLLDAVKQRLRESPSSQGESELLQARAEFQASLRQFQEMERRIRQDIWKRIKENPPPDHVRQLQLAYQEHIAALQREVEIYRAEKWQYGIESLTKEIDTYNACLRELPAQ
jgi:hypothetical protein